MCNKKLIVSVLGIKSLIIHKKTKSEVYFRCIVANSTAKHLIKFIGNYSIAGNTLEEHFEMPAVYCDIWPESYCFHISNLDGNIMYIFNVSTENFINYLRKYNRVGMVYFMYLLK